MREMPARSGLLLLSLLLGGCEAGGAPRVQDVTRPSPRAVLPTEAQVRIDPVNGTIKSLKAANLAASLENDGCFTQRRERGDLAGASICFLQAMADRLRLQDPRRELSLKSATMDELGYFHVRLLQQYGGLPVWGSEILVHWSPRKMIYLVEGDYLPTPSTVSTTPGMDPAAAIAKAEIAASAPCRDCEAELGIVRSGGGRLAYRVRIPKGIVRLWTVVVDARDGEILEQVLAPR